MSDPIDTKRRREQFIRHRTPTRTEGIALCDEVDRLRAECEALRAVAEAAAAYLSDDVLAEDLGPTLDALRDALAALEADR